MALSIFFSMPLFLMSGGLLLICYLVVSFISYRRLSHIPGPRLWGWSILPLFHLHGTGQIYNKFGELATKYGPLVRIGPNYLLASDPEVHRRMAAPRSPYTRSLWYRAARLTPGVDNVLSEIDESRHNELRKRMAAGYSGKENPHLESDIDECILDLMNLINRKYVSADGSVRMEFARKVQYFTSDIMSKLSFDAKFHDLRDDNDNYGYIHEVETIYPNIFVVSVIPAVIDFFTKLGVLDWVTPSEDSKLGVGKIQAITRAQIASRFDSEEQPKDGQHDMLGSFIRHGLTRKELEQESMLQLAAGSDTSATAIRATMLCILRDPRVHKKLVAEIDEAVKEHKISSSETEVIPDAQARTLPYLQAVIKEGMRWFPPIAGLLAKQVPLGGDTICGRFVPEGTAIAYSANAIHHSASLFGPDEYTFRPERWIHTSQGGDEPSAAKLSEMERNNELLFGYGKYQCLGKGIALMELNKIYVELLRRFEFTLLHPDDPWKTRCFGIHLQEGLWVTVKRRNTA
ncbi:uncharacterized protein Z518_01812 [Rhinocladiella mackenziei CBS 650.93]|uniref:Rhinocladiella mackenziei CBS 650.93 unplaced genomic scaffold supercont1.2, whole genome shotgun sequence n=1 Tax=Rhinocladiella mackenziei CBS 650.93 TaxID=1442369 RepID=A0A0D2IMY7_9EURO|nr:uncharacterized protein Z518_01812 [Rhinocladiella mackenziei CBS 650.93]KIX07159.1 hypothetical protein Z518_01812 [Rhinocladiella mackenziei CBS 650.93]